jgi:hypothetical protein
VGKWTADVNTDPHKTVHTLATADPAGSDFRSAYSNYYTKYSQAANPASQTPEQRYDRGYQYTIQ